MVCGSAFQPRRLFGLALMLFLLLFSSTATVSAMPDAGKPSEPTSRTLMDDVQDGIGQAGNSLKEIIKDMSKHSTLAGNVEPFVHKLHVTSQEAAEIAASLRKTVHWEDVVLYLAVGWLSLPALQVPYELLPPGLKISLKEWYHVMSLLLDHLQQISKIALLVYIVDVLKMICIGMGFDFCKMDAFPHAFCQAAFTLWGTNRVAVLKKHYVRQFVSHRPEMYGRMQIMNRLADAVLGALTGFCLLNIVQVKMGVAITSLLALSSAGTLAVGLASQGLAKQVLNGLMLASSDRIYEGDAVRFGDGKDGTIVKLGWMETVLRGDDDILISIPNTDLVNQPVSNLSRISHSQVKQVLRFRYADREKVPRVLESIKEEVQLSCPELVTDGSLPFRAHWTDYQPGHIEAVVNFHFRIKPVGDAYWDNRQRVLETIDKALRKNDIELKN